jgi:hypothetical protein
VISRQVCELVHKTHTDMTLILRRMRPALLAAVQNYELMNTGRRSPYVPKPQESGLELSRRVKTVVDQGRRESESADAFASRVREVQASRVPAETQAEFAARMQQVAQDLLHAQTVLSCGAAFLRARILHCINIESLTPDQTRALLWIVGYYHGVTQLCASRSPCRKILCGIASVARDRMLARSKAEEARKKAGLPISDKDASDLELRNHKDSSAATMFSGSLLEVILSYYQTTFSAPDKATQQREFQLLTTCVHPLMLQEVLPALHLQSFSFSPSAPSSSSSSSR